MGVSQRCAHPREMSQGIDKKVCECKTGNSPRQAGNIQLSDDQNILQFETPVILVGPADVDITRLETLASRSYPIIAADGGANILLQMGIQPTAIIGDLDSLDRDLMIDAGVTLLHIPEQETTDFEKCLYSVEAPMFLALGFIGGRFDHTLATLHAMAKFIGQKYVLLIGREDASFIHMGELTLATEPGQVVSIFPLSSIEFASSKGLKYPLDGLKFDIGTKIGTSNLATGDEARIIPAAGYFEVPYLVTVPGNGLEGLLG